MIHHGPRGPGADVGRLKGHHVGAMGVLLYPHLVNHGAVLSNMQTPVRSGSTDK